MQSEKNRLLGGSGVQMDAKNRAHNSGWTRLGYTLVELLTSVAIIIILTAVAFVGIYQARLTMLQIELDATAKEIFMAAQNHLALAQSQGILDRSGAGAVGLGTEDGNDRYFVITAVDNPDDATKALSLMLPFGAIDETIRTGGSYILRYQPTTGRVLDVFYAKPNGWRSHSFSSGEYGAVKALAGADKAANRKNYSGASIGWYGGTGDATTFASIAAPTVEVKNGDKLEVKVTKDASDNTSNQLRLIIEGQTSGAKMWFNVASGDWLNLDDVTESPEADGNVNLTGSMALLRGRFYKIVAAVSSDNKQVKTVGEGASATSQDFIPGENLKMYAWASKTDGPAIVAKSAEVRTNSLFASGKVSKTDNTLYEVEISSFRHLSNLAYSVSHFNRLKKANETTPVITKVNAVQKTDLKWSTFMNNTRSGSHQVFIQSDDNTVTTTGDTFRPVICDYHLTYSGLTTKATDSSEKEIHAIIGATVNATSSGNDDSKSAGIFQTLGATMTIENLQLVDCNVTGATNVGTLAGKAASGAKIKNVCVRQSVESSSPCKVTAVGTAGGLIGVSNGATIEGCAAAVIVNAGTGSAGGLVGDATGDTISNSYAAGHTSGGKYVGTNYVDNVKSTSGAAGGLVGTSTATISNCYSTCSVQAGSSVNAGGLVGTVSGGSITNCYATGLVNGGTAGAFIGGPSNASISGTCQYLKVVNQATKAVGTDSDDSTATYAASKRTNVTEGDIDITTYNTFAPTSDGAVPYDTTLTKRFGGKYTFKTIKQMIGDTAYAAIENPPTWLSTHYGDWPSYETNVVNTTTTPGSGS